MRKILFLLLHLKTGKRWVEEKAGQERRAILYSHLVLRIQILCWKLLYSRRFKHFLCDSGFLSNNAYTYYSAKPLCVGVGDKNYSTPIIYCSSTLCNREMSKVRISASFFLARQKFFSPICIPSPIGTAS